MCDQLFVVRLQQLLRKHFSQDIDLISWKDLDNMVTWRESVSGDKHIQYPF